MRPRGLLTSVLLAVVAMAVTACSQLPMLWAPAAEQSVTVERPAPPADHVALQQYDWIKGKSAEQLSSEVRALSEGVALQPGAPQRLRLAVTLGFGQCPECEVERAEALLRQIEAEGETESSRALAGIFLQLLEAQAQIAAQRQELLQARQRIETTQQQRRSLQHDLAALQQKLDALTSIEESLHQREQPEVIEDGRP